jgi:hypothetical protein
MGNKPSGCDFPGGTMIEIDTLLLKRPLPCVADDRRSAEVGVLRPEIWSSL